MQHIISSLAGRLRSSNHLPLPVTAAISQYVQVLPSKVIKTEVLQEVAKKVSALLRSYLSASSTAVVYEAINFDDLVAVDYTIGLFTKQGSENGKPWIPAWELGEVLLKMKAAGFESSYIQLGNAKRKEACVLGFVRKKRIQKSERN